jgi:hypothetical protein
MKLKLIDEWRKELHRLWSIRISIACGVFTGTAAVLSAFDDVFNPWFLLAVSIVVNVALIPLSRLVQQEKGSASEQG